MIEAPLRGQPATSSDDLMLLVNRKGFIEETHFSSRTAQSQTNRCQGRPSEACSAPSRRSLKRCTPGGQLATLRDLARQAGDAATGCPWPASTPRVSLAANDSRRTLLAPLLAGHHR